MVDVKDKDGYTVLQAAVKAAWVAGVCIALEAGADVTIRVISYMKHLYVQDIFTIKRT